MRLWPIIASGLIAGLIAGLLLGFLTLKFSTPLILKAEKYESHPGKQAEGSSPQRDVGTVVGAGIIGSAYGLILASVFALTGSKSASPLLKGLGYGFLGYVVIALIPSLAFLPNPPGVETKFSVEVRQGWWLAVILLELFGIVLYRVILRRLSSTTLVARHVLGVAVFVGLTSVPFVVGLPNQLRETLIPVDLLVSFRLVSLAILLAFWLLLGSGVGYLYSKLSEQT